MKTIQLVQVERKKDRLTVSQKRCNCPTCKPYNEQDDKEKMFNLERFKKNAIINATFQDVMMAYDEDGNSKYDMDIIQTKWFILCQSETDVINEIEPSTKKSNGLFKYACNWNGHNPNESWTYYGIESKTSWKFPYTNPVTKKIIKKGKGMA